MIWTKEKTAELTRLWAVGMTLEEIAHIMRVSRGTVWGRTRRLGLPSRRKRDWTVADVAELTQRWREGQSASAIAKMMQRGDKNAVLGKLNRLGLLNDPVRRPPKGARQHAWRANNPERARAYKNAWRLREASQG